MITKFAARILYVLAVLAPIVLALQPTRADAQGQPAQVQRVPTYTEQQEKINAWTVGLAAGLIEGAPLRLAAEMARVVDDGDNLHVLPIVTRGPTENLNSLLYLRGVDLAIISSDSLDEYKIQFPELRRHVTYLLNLFPSELHVFVRPEIKRTFIPHQVALQQMRKGDMAAVVFITSKPVDAFLRGQWEPGFKFLPVTYDSRFEDYYLPAVLEANEYPALIKPGERISTIAAPTVLVSYNWTAGSNRYQRVARFTDYLFSRVDKLQAAGFDPKWQTINLGATVPGLARFPAAQEWLERHGRQQQARQ
jgi:hypothetical protein